MDTSPHSNDLANAPKVFTPPPVAGYRKLTEHEVALMNKVKELGVQAELLHAEIIAHLQMQQDEARCLDSIVSDSTIAAQGAAEVARLERAEPFRHAALFKTHFQDAAMHLSRAVAQPTTFA